MSSALLDEDSVAWSPFPFRCWPLTLCIDASISVVQDWLHGVVLSGIIASAFITVNFLVKIDEECRELLCFVELFCSMVVTLTIFDMYRVIRDFNKVTDAQHRREEEEVGNLVRQHERSTHAYRENSARVSRNFNEMTAFVFRQKIDQTVALLHLVEEAMRGAVDGGLFKKLKSFVATEIRTLGTARVVPASRARDPVKVHLKKIQNCVTIGKLREAFLEGAREVMEIRVEFMVSSPQPLVPVPRPVAARGRCSRFCGGQGRCGCTWFSCFDPNEKNSGPKCWAIVPDPEDAFLLDPDFRPYTRHVLGLFCVRILSRAHLRVLRLFAVDIAVLMLWVKKVEDWFSLGMLVINATSILSMLLCFEQINSSSRAERRIREWRGVVAQARERDEEFRQLLQHWNAYQDRMNIMIVPLLQIQAGVEHVLHTNRLARERAAEELMDRAIECVEAMREALRPLQDGLQNRLSQRWMDEMGRALRDFAEMTSVRSAEGEEQLSLLLQHLEDGLRLAAALQDRSAQMFVQDVDPAVQVLQVQEASSPNAASSSSEAASQAAIGS